jgi:hypothetical protein
MQRYSKNGEYPTFLPNRIKLSDGSTRTDRNTFTPEEIASAGYTEVESPPVADYPNKVEWTGTGWSVRDPNESEIAERWNFIKQECERRLFDTDYKVIKAVELNETLDPAMIQYRQELRDLYNNVNNIDPWNFTWPIHPDAVLEEPAEDPATAAVENSANTSTV